MDLFLQLLLNGLLIGVLYALVGVSWGLIYATTKVFHFAHILSLLVGVYSAIVVVNATSLPFWAGFVIAAVASAIVGLISEVVVYRPMRAAHAKPLNIFLASLGLLEAGRYTMQLIFGANPMPIPSAPNQAYQLGFISITANELLRVGASAILIVAVLEWLARSRAGQRIRAVATNPDLSHSVGISSDKVYISVFVIGSALVGVAGYLLALSRGGSLEMGLIPVLAGFTATFLGGVGRHWGTVLAGFLLGVSEQLSGLILSGQWQTVTAFTVLLLVLMYRPQGLFAFRS